MNISESNVKETIEKSRTLLLIKNKSISVHNRDVRFRNFLRKH